MLKSDIVVGATFKFPREGILYTIKKILPTGLVEIMWETGNCHFTTKYRLTDFVDSCELVSPGLILESREKRIINKINFLYEKQRSAGIRI